MGNIWEVIEIRQEKVKDEKIEKSSSDGKFDRFYSSSDKTEFAELDTPEALHNAGVKYCRGEEVSQNYKKAADLWKRAANQGLAESQYGLGRLYETGKGVIQNDDEALKWYYKAAEQGHEKAQKRFNELFQELRYKTIPQETENSSQRAFHEAKKEVKHSPEKLFALGENYYYGNGVVQSYEKAIEWYEKAANQGFEEAQCTLGYMYSNGKGVKQNYYKAVEWYRKAANKGYAKGQYNLGTMYFNGRGVKKDVEHAKILFDRAAKNGDPDAQKVLARLSRY